MTEQKSVFHRYRRVLSALGTLLIVVLIFWTVNSPAIVGVSASNRQLPVYCVQRDDKVVAMSFDAAWGNEDTQTIIDILNKYGINTTFFVVGDWVDKYPESVRALAENGNEIMNHSSTHSHFSQLSHSDIIADITACNEKIAELTGVTPTLFRCPYGEYNDNVITTVRDMGYEVWQWDIDTIDWKEERSAQTILDTVIPKLHPGCVILCHNNGYKIKEYLPTLIETAQEQGYEFVTVSELRLEGDTIIDVNGTQKAA